MARTEPETPVRLAVNGTLMRGLELNGNLVRAGARFVCEATTAPCYRLWSIDGRCPAMIRSVSGGAPIAVEIWELPAAGLASLLLQEPRGLSIGRVLLSDGEEDLGVLGEPYVCEGREEITAWGGWREYRAGALRGDQRPGR